MTWNLTGHENFHKSYVAWNLTWHEVCEISRDILSNSFRFSDLTRTIMLNLDTFPISKVSFSAWPTPIVERYGSMSNNDFSTLFLWKMQHMSNHCIVRQKVFNWACLSCEMVRTNGTMTNCPSSDGPWRVHLFNSWSSRIFGWHCYWEADGRPWQVVSSEDLT